MTFKVEVIADSSGKWAGNELTFDTETEAEEYAKDLQFRWTSVREYRVIPATRTLRAIAREIKLDWQKVNYAAVPYLNAMLEMDSINDDYGYDSGQSIVAYFLGNARSWRGDVAKRVKAELKALSRA